MSADKTVITGTQPSVPTSNDIDGIQIEGYSIKRFIARGGMAAVYLARQETLGRDVALKVMDKNDDETFIERFLNEGRLVASMSHPNVITIYDLGVLDDGRAYLSMEFVDGGDLEGRLKEPLTEIQALAILRSLGECLSYVHKHDVIHRDIKPANILFKKDGTLVLTDFGIARQTDQDVALTRDGMAVGSPGYMSPEQAQAQHVDLRTDLYSVGVIFTEMLLGENKYADDSYIQTSMNHIQMDIPSLPMPICQYQILVNKMLAKDADKRFKDADGLIRFVDQLPEPENRRLPVTSDSDNEVLEEESSFEPDPDFESNKSGLYSNAGGLVTGGIFIALVLATVWFFRLHIIPLDYLPKADQAALYVLQAEKAFKADRLLVPKDASAAFYYAKALDIEPSSVDAKQGMTQIADRYARLAKQAASSNNRKKLRLYVNRGLSVDSSHKDLLALKKQYRL